MFTDIDSEKKKEWEKKQKSKQKEIERNEVCAENAFV